MKKTSYLFIALAFFSSCSVSRNTVSSRTVRQNNNEVRKSNPGSNAHQSLTSLEYIDKYKQVAIQEMNSFGIPASITLAQGLYESSAGNSELARVANNHFGIKAGYGWNGEVYYKDDDERNDAFRVYNNVEESFRDHSNFLKKKNYASLYTLDITDYKGWARGLKRAGYATNPEYPQMIIGIIEKYNLQQYDVQGGVPAPKAPTAAVMATPPPPAPPVAAIPVSVAPVTTAPVIAAPVVTADTSAAAPTATASKTYTIKQGDTLYNISRRYGLTVDDLKTLNSLNGNNLQIGQILVVVK
jgi:nucleoid-associated protein YgaU